MNKKIKTLFLFVTLVVFSLTFTGKVSAATYHQGTKLLNYSDFGLGSGHNTYYNKKVNSAIAYCVETSKAAPKDGVTVTSYGSIYSTQHYVAGQIIRIGRAKYSGEKEYMYIQQALNCYFKYNKSYLGGCTSEINSIVNDAKKYVNNYKYNPGSKTSSLPKISVTTSPTLTKTAASTSQNATYVSSVIKIKGLDNTNFGSVNTKYTTSTKPSYKIELKKCIAGNCVSDNTIKLCTNAEGTAGCINNGGSINAPSNGTSGELSYYLIVTNAGINGGSASLKITGTNESKYPSGKMWVKESYQRLVTYTDDVTLKRNVSATASFKYAPADKYSVAIAKVDDTGEVLPGASLRLYTAANEAGTSDTVTLCTTSATDPKGECTRTGLTTSDSYKYNTGRYICYSEATTPPGYVKIEPFCRPITLGSKKEYYKIEVSSGNETVATEADYNKASSYNQGTDLQYQYHTGAGTAATDYTYTTASKMYKYVYEDGRPIEYKETDEEYKHVETTGTEGEETIVTTWYIEDPDTGNRININVTELNGTQVCYNTTAGPTTNTDYCSAEYQYTEFTFSSGNAIINVGNSLNFVNISKKAITGDDEVPGATLSIFKADSSGKCSTELAKSKNFIYNPYVPSETNTGGESGSATDDNGSTTDEGSDDDTEDQDFDEGNDEGIDIANTGLRWVSSNTSATVYGLAPGNYCLQEELPPSGYKLNPTVVKFKMNESGEITVTGRDYYDEESKTLILRDEYTKISISKADIATSKEIPGAELKICGARKKDNGDYEVISGEAGDEAECTPDLLVDGTPAAWTSGTEPHEIIGLAAGTYFLVETTAPEGYAVAESILFTLKDDGTLTDVNGKSLADNKITMYDEHKVKVPNTLANASLIISALGALFIAGSVIGYIYTLRKKEQNN